MGLRDALTYVARGLNREELGRDAEAIEDYDAALKLGLPALEAEDLRQRRAELARRLEEAHLAPAKRADVYFNQGLSAAHAGRLQEAIDHAEESLAQELSARALILRGDCRWKLKQVDAAIADFSEALRLEPRNVLALRQRALSLMSLGRGPEAIADFDRLLELDPGNVDAYVNRAVVKFRLGRIGEASLDYERALRLSPQSWDVLLGLASCKANLGRDAEAIEDYDRALALEPRYAPGYKERGLSKAKLGRHAEAIEDFDRALRLGLSEGDAEEARRLRAEANAARKAAQPEGS